MAKLREPASAYAAAPETQLRAKLFQNGRSQAVRLPKAFRLPGKEVLIRKEGSCLVLEPIPVVPRDALGWPIGFWENLARLREGLDLDEFQLPDDPVPEPILPMDEI